MTNSRESALRMLGFYNGGGTLCDPADWLNPELKYMLHLGGPTYKPTEADGQRVVELLETVGFPLVKVTPKPAPCEGVAFYSRKGDKVCVFIPQQKEKPEAKPTPSQEPVAKPVAKPEPKLKTQAADFEDVVDTVPLRVPAALPESKLDPAPTSRVSAKPSKTKGRVFEPPKKTDKALQGRSTSTLKPKPKKG